MSTDYHSQYWAHTLTLKSASDRIDNLSRSIANAKVDLMACCWYAWNGN